MSDDKHTPGPWDVIADSGHYDSLTTVIGGGSSNYWPHWRMIVQVGGASSVEEAEANASLIAAAPDLLEALQELRYACTDKALKMAQDAIAKALDYKEWR